MNTLRTIGIIAALGALPALGYATGRNLNDSSWTTEGLAAIDHAKKLDDHRRERAKNVILFVGDGMGVSTVTAARILEGQKRGRPGEENSLSFEHFPYLSLVKTYSVNQQTSDSAPTMTAMVTGVKTKDGILALDEDAVRGDHTTVRGNELTTILAHRRSRPRDGHRVDHAHHPRHARGLLRKEPRARLGVRRRADRSCPRGRLSGHQREAGAQLLGRWF